MLELFGQSFRKLLQKYFPPVLPVDVQLASRSLLQPVLPSSPPGRSPTPHPMQNFSSEVVPSDLLTVTMPDTALGARPPPSRTWLSDDPVNGLTAQARAVPRLAIQVAVGS